MSIETQAILVGHVSAERVASVLRTAVTGQVAVRDMQRSEYKVVEFQGDDGTWSVLHLFLDSSVAEDYADVYQGASTFMTAEYSPTNYDLVRSIMAALGGFARKTPAEPWTALEPIRS